MQDMMKNQVERNSFDSDTDTDAIAQLCISKYLGLPKSFHPAPRSNGTPQWCILAGIVLGKPASASSIDPPSSCPNPSPLKCISLGAGTKCLPQAKLPPNGDILHDSHAEVVARRGAIRWIYEEVLRWKQGKESSDWIERDGEDGVFGLKPGVQVYMYVSTLPCGDASTMLLSVSQDPAMAELKDASRKTPESPASEARPTVGRGRDDYSALGMLRTKPGRADSPPTISMSCSDKIASWTLLGFQGALLSQFMKPVYLNALIFGEVEAGLKPGVVKECERAFATRLHSDVAISWIANTSPAAEALVDGRKRGSSVKAKSTAYRSRISKAALFDLHLDSETVLMPNQFTQLTHFEAKQKAAEYQRSKAALRGEGGPLAGWIVSGQQWEGFHSSRPSSNK
ncbi:hypothetical protein FRC04_009283 [Tulasnella sp. 424]|nr:hypothetical protein FRC04_009283 [Tulasnella sp. 424]KAG8973103.1 hypothetical protein FRC05_009112 [Tulasnella sp. 425]